MFLLDSEGYPRSVAGVPPDYFCEDGQLWGNPLYDYKKMKSDGFSWWKRRVEYMLELFDGVRIDHFRGFESFYSIPYGAKSAKEGKWVKAPGREIINAIKSVAKDKLIIAEDLGDITPQVDALRNYSGFPGMRVFQFGFLGDPNSPHTPHNYTENSVAYSGTHDNNTLLGYVWEMTPENRREVFDYVGERSEDFALGVESIVKTILRSNAAIAILPIQDVFGYGRDTRMNVPGSPDGNWAYRITREQLDLVNRAKLRKMNEIYRRI
jgi:4-alpha-glucanotransferase